MKKLTLSALLAVGLLAGCNNDDEAATSIEDVKKEAVEIPQTTENKKEAAASPERTITPEQAKEALTKIEDNAKKDQKLKDVKVEETKDTVKATFEFAKDSTDEDKGIALLNYQIMLQAAYPDKEIDIEIKK